MKIFKKLLNSNFIGKNLSRFKVSIGYYTAFVATLNVIMNFKSAYPIIEIEWALLFSPILIIGAVILGYFLDKYNVSSQDTRKSNEMAHRFLLTSDIKSQQFQLMQTKVLLQALQDFKEGKDIDMNNLEKEYESYFEKWKAPKTN